MKRIAVYFFAAVAFIAAAASAFAQSTVLQGGAMTSGHIPMYVQGGGVGAQPVIQDSGPASGGPIGLGISEQLLTIRGAGNGPYANAGTGPLATNWCDYDAPITNAGGYHYLCLSPNAQGGGLLAYGAAGGASTLPFTINVNGQPFTFGGGSGNGFATVVVPTANGAVVCFSGTTGLIASCPGVTNAQLATVPAATFKGNPSGNASVVPTDFTISGLVARGAPDATNDKLVILDNATGTFKYVTPGQIASSATAGVSSIGGATGVILLGTNLSIAGQTINATAVSPGGSNGQLQYNNSGTFGGMPAMNGDATLTTSTGAIVVAKPALEKTGAYAAVTGDCGSTITLGGGAQYQLTLNAASGYATNCSLKIINLATESRTKTIAPNGLTAFFLYPGQTVVITNQSSAWNVSQPAGRWRLAATTTFFVRPDGSDTNDGLANSAGGAFLTPNAAFASVSTNVDINSQTMNVQHTCSSPPCTITANAQLLNLVNTKFTGGIPTYAGDCTTPSNVVLAPTSPGSLGVIHISLGDYVYVCGFKLSGGSTNAPIGMYVSGGQEINITGPMIFDNLGTGLEVNSHAHLYVDGPLTFSHSMSVGISVLRQAYLEPGQGETITLSGTPAWGFAFIQASLGSVFNIAGFTYAGSSTGLSASVTYNAVLDSSGAACAGLPGNGTVSTSNGGVCF